MGRPSPRHGAAVRGRTQNFFAGFMAKNFVDGISSPTAETGCGYSSPGKSIIAGKQAAGVAAEGLTAPSGAVALPVHRVQEAPFPARQGGATGTVAASPVFQTSDRSGSPKPRQRVSAETGGCASSCLSSRA